MERRHEARPATATASVAERAAAAGLTLAPERLALLEAVVDQFDAATRQLAALDLAAAAPAATFDPRWETSDDGPDGR